MSAVGAPTSNTNSASASSVAVSKPTGLAVGDLLLAHVISRNNSGGSATDPTLPTGWTQLYLDPITGGGPGAIFWKIADSTDAAASSFTFSGGTGTDRIAAGLSKFSNVDAVAINASNHNTGTGQSMSTSGITPTVQSMLVMLAVKLYVATSANSISGYAIATDNGTWTEAYDFTGGPYTMSMAYSADRTATTATGNATATIANSNVDGWQLVVLSLSPAIVRPSALSAVVGLLSPIVPKFPAALSAVAGFFAPTVDIIAPIWTNAVKDATTWTNQDKS